MHERCQRLHGFVQTHTMQRMVSIKKLIPLVTLVYPARKVPLI